MIAATEPWLRAGTEFRAARFIGVSAVPIPSPSNASGGHSLIASGAGDPAEQQHRTPAIAIPPTIGITGPSRSNSRPPIGIAIIIVTLEGNSSRPAWRALYPSRSWR